MTAYAAAAAGPLTAEPDKRVNYTLGLVLGVDEFQQEQLYHMAGRRWHNRLLHGYGTVWGLALTMPDPGDADPEIRVGAGVAVDPCGREICVPDTMCLGLDGWLERHRDTLDELYPGGTPELPLAVVLCYRECATDVVPIPGEPCRTQEDAMQPSRLRDSFELRLALREEGLPGSPPGENRTGLHLYGTDHAEEAAVRAFGELLAGIELVTVAPPGSGLDELIAAVRRLADPEGGLASPPAGDIVLPANEAPDALREAFRVWVTEVRPSIRAREPGGASCPREGEECCVLLGEVDLPVTGDWAVAGEAFEAREENRPVLLHTRLLQEWLSLGEGGSGNDDTFATLEQVAADTVRVWFHYPVPLVLEAGDVAVLVEGGAAEAPAAVGAVAGADNVFDVSLSAEPGDGATVELRFDLTSIAVTGSPPGSLEDALYSSEGGLLDRYGPEVRAYTIFSVPTLVLPDYAGDLEGSHPDATVVGLQGNPVEPTSPDSGDVLTWDGSAWVPASVPSPEPPALPPAAGDLEGSYPDIGVVGLRRRPVADAEPRAGQVLTWSAGGQWQPQDVAVPPTVVTAPEPGFSVVAAGSFDAAGAPAGPVFNNLAARPLATREGHYNLRFTGYRRPDDSFALIVKGIAENPRPDGVPFVVEFVQFLAETFQVRVVDAQGNATRNGFMIEISRIDRRA